MTNQPKFIVDEVGNRLFAILPIDDYNEMIEELEELEDLRLYLEAKKEDTGQRISIADYIESRKLKDAQVWNFLYKKSSKTTW